MSSSLSSRSAVKPLTPTKPAKADVSTSRADQVRSRIVRAATSAFNKKGYEGASLRSIAALAGITPQLLTHHCKSKLNLWKTVMLEARDSWESSLHENPENPKWSATEKLKNYIRSVVVWTRVNPDLYRLWYQELSQFTPRQAWFTETIERPIYDRVLQMIAEGQSEGRVVRFDAARLRFAIVSLAGLPFSNFAEYEYLTGRDPFTDQEVDATLSLIYRLIFVDSGSG